MVIIPGINCPDFGCVKKHWGEAGALGARTVQIDVSDGVFAPVKSWGEPAELAVLIKQNPAVEAEVHLMIENPAGVFGKWLEAGAKRLAVHVEAAKDLEKLREIAVRYGAELVLAIKLETNLDVLESYLDAHPDTSVQILDVSAGFSGQKFNPAVLEKIKLLREKRPDVKIRIDGGMNPETAKLVKDAGADAVIAFSYIWESASPEEAYQSLLKI